MPGPKFSLDWSTFFFFWKFGFSSSTNNYFTQISRKFWTENIFGRMATAQKFPPYFPSYHLQRQFIARNVLCIGIDEAKLKRNIGVHQTKSWITIQTHLEKVCRQTKLKFPWNNGVGEIKNWKEKNSNASNFEDTRKVSSFWTSKTLNFQWSIKTLRRKYHENESLHYKISKIVKYHHLDPPKLWLFGGTVYDCSSKFADNWQRRRNSFWPFKTWWVRESIGVMSVKNFGGQYYCHLTSK